VTNNRRNQVDSKETVGLGFSSALAVLFVGLKLAHVITWSWWWVLAPWWIPAALGVALVFVVVLLAVVSAVRR
jgi:membrane protein YdbS with pleckstrin-like domain